MSESSTIKPPKFAENFLKFYCKPQLLEEILGDLYELFDYRNNERTSKYAKWMFVWEVFRFFKWSNIKNSKKITLNNTAMLKNYFKIGFRNLNKSKVTSVINVTGLSLSIGVAIVVFLFLDFQYSMDDYHENVDDVYQVTNYVKENSQESQWGRVPIPLKNVISQEIPQVVRSGRMESKIGIFKHGEQVLNERISFVDPEVMEIFSFPLLYGQSNVLNNEKQIIISKKVSEKYFGTENPVGQEIEIVFNRSTKEVFSIGAVTATPPPNSSIKVDIYIPFNNYPRIYDYDPNDWANFVDVTFIQLQKTASNKSVNALLDSKYIDIQNEAEDDWQISHYNTVELKNLSLSNHEIDYAYASGGHPGGRIALATVAVLLLLLSCFNYMNIAVVSVTNRLKEIGLRKTMGGSRGEIVQQFLIENLIVTGISAVVGLLIAYYLLLPGFNSGFPMEIPFAFSSNTAMIGFFGGLLLSISLISGAYPALYISSFTPAKIFRGNQKFGKKNFFSKSFLVFQFALAFITILSGVIFTQNSEFQKNQDWGYNETSVIGIPIESEQHYTLLKQKFSQNSDVKLISGTVDHVGEGYSMINLEFESEKMQTASFEIGFDYLETLELAVVKGRTFDSNIASDKTESVIVSTLFADKMGWQDPLSQQVLIDSTNYYVIGVVDNFYYENFINAMSPAVFRIVPESEFKYVAVKVAPEQLAKTAQYSADIWKEVEPDLPYAGFMQNSVFDHFFMEMNANNQIMRFISIMALILACMGLFGLVSFNINRKMKEYSIRRVLGADLRNITKSVNNDFIWYLIIAGVISAPVAYYLMNMLLTSVFAVNMPMSIWPFLMAFFTVMLTAYVTISSQILKVAKDNPADTLRIE